MKEMLFVTSNGDEGSLFTSILVPESAIAFIGLDRYIEGLFPTLEQEEIEKVVKLYTGLGEDVASAASKLLDEGMCPSSIVASAANTIRSDLHLPRLRNFGCIHGSGETGVEGSFRCASCLAWQ